MSSPRDQSKKAFTPISRSKGMGDPAGTVTKTKGGGDNVRKISKSGGMTPSQSLGGTPDGDTLSKPGY